jgi:hypothetical protein
MGIPAGLLNRRVTFLRRAPVPAEGDSPRGGYEYTGEAQWGGYRPRNARETRIGGLDLYVSTGVLTLRDNPVTRALSTAQRVSLDGEIYEIIGRQIAEKPDGMLRFDVQLAPSSAMYDRELESRGDIVTVRRVVPNAPAIEARARAIVTGYRPEEITGGIQVGHRRVILSAPDLAAGGFPEPPRTNDKIIVNGRQLNVMAVDENTHRIAGVLHAYEIQAAG